jgi:urease accessory protein
MAQKIVRLGFGVVALALGGAPAYAHHLMGGRTPATFAEGMLSGLAHPVIGLDHFAAVVAVGCLAAAHRSASALAIAFVVAMMAGVALHLHGATVPGAEILVTLTILALGTLMILRRGISTSSALALFAGVGIIHGYALGESIYGAEPTPLYAYLAGLAIIQGTIALTAARLTQLFAQRSRDVSPLRLVGAGIVGIGLAALMQQVIPGA